MMKKATIFGKYLLLDRLNVGGMAEVFIAKAFGVEGLERYIAIKRILPSMAEDLEFIQMFIDEARISVQLNHANIVHIHELEKVDDSYYIAMEYVAGKDVRTLLERYRKLGEPMPVAQAAFIASKMCEGLHYAHTRKDPRGQELGIIHRDVSPQNILVSYEGEVKIIDFGIAKAANRSQKTQAGILKGKFGYMSPEMVRGLPIDRRSDIFALGIILFELLTGEKLFTGESDYSVLEKVRNAQLPEPREINPEIPAGLERILRKALAREVEDRYQWASEMQEDLVRFLLVGDQIFTSRHLSEFMKAAFAEEILRENAQMEVYATVERPAELDGGGGRRTPPPAPANPAAFGVDEDEDTGAGKTQLIDPEVAALATRPEDVDPGENPEATRFDAVNPFGHEVEEPPERGGRVVIGAGESYAGATVIGEIPALRSNDGETRVFAGRGPADEDADKTQAGDSLVPDVFRDDLEPEHGGEEDPEGYGDEEEPYEDDPEAYEEEDPEEITGSVSRPGSPPAAGGAPLARLMAWRWFPHAAAGAAGLLVLLLILLAVGLRGPSGQPLVIRATGAEGIQITLDGEPVKNGVVTEVLPGAHEIAASAPGFLTEHRSVSVTEGEAPPVVELALRSAHPAPEPAPPAEAPVQAAAPESAPPTEEPMAAQAPEEPQAPKTFSARFDAETEGIEVSVDGKSVGQTPAAKLAELEVGKTYHFTAQRAGYKTRSGTFNSADGSDVVIPVDLDPVPRPKPAPRPEPRHVRREAPSAPATPRRTARSTRSRAKGRLAASTHPAGAEIYVDNRPTGRHTPVAPGSPLMIPVGTHKIYFRLGSKKSSVQTVVIDENETTKLINVPLQ